MLNLQTQERGFSIIAATGALIIIGLLMMAGLRLVLDHTRRASLFADHALALQEAEAALTVAECRIAVATDTPAHQDCSAAHDREHIASLDALTLSGFVPGQCGQGEALGLCWPLVGQSAQSLSKLLADKPDAVTLPTPVQAGARQTPALAARYVIEPIPDALPGRWIEAGSARAPSLFRITAAGFGTDRAVNVMLQTIYRPRVAAP